jgi:branched-chain amino acid transport system permease protein
MDYILHIATLIIMNIALVHAINIYLGYTNILALSHTAFFGLGAYAGALMLIHTGSIWLGFLAAFAVAFTLGILIGLTSIKLSADYLGIATLGFAVIITTVMLTWTDLTRGPLGLVVPKPSIGDITFSTKLEMFMLMLAVCTILTIFMWRMVKSPFGRVLETIRDDEVAAKSLGINTTYYKLVVFSLGSAIAALVGAVYAPFIGFIAPSSFGLNELAMYLVMMMLGGLGTFRGPFIGATFIILLKEGVRFLENIEFLHIGPEHVGGIQLFSYSFIFLIVMLYFPKGIGGYLKDRKRHRKQFTSY